MLEVAVSIGANVALGAVSTLAQVAVTHLRMTIKLTQRERPVTPEASLHARSPSSGIAARNGRTMLNGRSSSVGTNSSLA